MKKFIIGFVLDMVFDTLIRTLEKYANRSSSTVDDKMVAVLVAEQDSIKTDILRSL